MIIHISPIPEPPFIIYSSLVSPPKFQLYYENEECEDGYQSDYFREVRNEFLQILTQTFRANRLFRAMCPEGFELSDGSLTHHDSLARSKPYWGRTARDFQAGSSGWDSGGLYSPSVILDAGLYKMWYSGYSGSSYGVGFATSSNGLLWTKYSGNPVITNVDDQQVILVGSTYRMYHSWGLSTFGYSDAPANTVIPEFSINSQYLAIVGLMLMCVLIVRSASDRSVRGVRA